MGWKGTVRSIGAAARRADRAAVRRQRELERRQREYEKMQELEQAAYEVDVYNNYIERITSVHIEESKQVNWRAIRDAKAPNPPEVISHRTEKAEATLKNYKPNFFSKIFINEEKRIQKLKLEIEKSKKLDQEEYENLRNDYEIECENCKNNKELAARVLAFEPDALIEAIKIFGPYKEIEELGSKMEFGIDEDKIVKCSVKVHSKDIIPEDKRYLLKSGKLSSKAMPKREFYELYQDYVCGVILRVANETFSVLPIDRMIVTAVDDLLNTSTGHVEEQPIVSAYIPRETIEKLHMERLDPSDAMENFLHHMSFKKTKGFDAVEEISPPMSV